MIYNSNMKLADRRTTKYVTEVKKVVRLRGHASNAEILADLRENYPELSATTVHRVTQRLFVDGELAKAPTALDGAVRYDANTQRHDHFMCVMCGNIRDISIPKTFVSVIQCNLEDCVISGPLTISGTCKSCKEEWQ